MTEDMEKSNEGDETMYQTLKCYHQLATDQAKHSILVKDKTMIQFLAYSLDSNDKKIVETALQTLDLLAYNSNHRQELSSTFGVLEALKATYERDIGEDLQKVARRVYIKLEDPHYEEPKVNSEPGLLNDSDNSKKKFSSNVYSFQVFGLNDESRANLESALVKVKGVISLVVYPEHQRCIVRAVEKVSAEQLAEAIYDKANLDAHLVVRNRLNQEVLKDILGKKKLRNQMQGRGDLSPILKYIENNDPVDSDEDLPPYLPEEESPVKEKALHPLDRFRTSAVSWVKTATSLFQNSFYW